MVQKSSVRKLPATQFISKATLTRVTGMSYGRQSELADAAGVKLVTLRAKDGLAGQTIHVYRHADVIRLLKAGGYTPVLTQGGQNALAHYVIEIPAIEEEKEAR